jgi:hypothetical protein
MIGRPIRKGSKAPQETGLLSPELGDCSEGFGPGHNRKQGEQQDLVKRVNDLADLPWIRQISKMIQKNNAL